MTNLQPETEEQPRSFKGKTSDFKDKQERSFEQKRLKAYLKGYDNFQYGDTRIGDRILPNYYSVDKGERVTGDIKATNRSEIRRSRRLS